MTPFNWQAPETFCDGEFLIVAAPNNAAGSEIRMGAEEVEALYFKSTRFSADWSFMRGAPSLNLFLKAKYELSYSWKKEQEKNALKLFARGEEWASAIFSPVQKRTDWLVDKAKRTATCTIDDRDLPDSALQRADCAS